MRKLSTITLVLAAAAAGGGATDCGEAIDDSGFDTWRDGELVHWRVEKGAVAPAPTWHEGDLGVELVGAEVAISQLSEVAASDGHCLAFELVADVEEDADVHLQVDLYGDGTVELDERIPTSDWRALRYRVRMPASYDGVRFRLTKLGGHAVLANIGARIVRDDECAGEALDPGLRPVGIACTAGSECASGICADDVCATCAADADCGPGGICAIADRVDANRTEWRTCAPAGGLPLGAFCLDDAWCATGICAGTVCSLCQDDSTCGGGTCETLRTTVDFGGTYEPVDYPAGMHCAPAVVAPAGSPCIADGDCASGACRGEDLGVCAAPGGFFLWPRHCDDDMDCPGYAFGDWPRCVTVGIRGGVCQ